MARAAAGAGAPHGQIERAAARAWWRARAIGDVVEPVALLLIEIPIIAKRPPVNEIVAEIADGPLDFALGLGSIGSTRARREAPVVREAKKLEIAHERAALEAQVARDHGFHLVEKELRGTPPNSGTRPQTIDQCPHVLAHVDRHHSSRE